MDLQVLKKTHISCVYCLEFPNGKSYVGKCHDLGKRLGLYERCVSGVMRDTGSKVVDALREFGFDRVGLRVLREVKCSDKTDREICLSILEIKYIREFNSCHSNGYNVSLGGEVLGIPVEHITTDEAMIKSLSGNSRVILEYDLSGNFIKEYPSLSRYAYERGFDEDSVRCSLNKRKPYFGKYYLRSKRYDVIPERIEVDEYQVKERIKYKDIIEERVIVRDKIETREIPAIIYDMNGDFVGEYSSRAEAARNLVTAKGMPWGKYCQGYIAFKKTSDDYPKKIESYIELNGKVLDEVYKPITLLGEMPQMKTEFRSRKVSDIKNAFPINQFTKDGRFVAQYASIRDASRDTGITYSCIYACVLGKTRTAKGFIWQRAD